MLPVEAACVTEFHGVDSEKDGWKSEATNLEYLEKLNSFNCKLRTLWADRLNVC